MIDNLTLSLTIIKKAKTIRKTTKEIKCFYAKRKIIDILVIRNSPNIVLTLEFLI
jgi:hypothetical protein